MSLLTLADAAAAAVPAPAEAAAPDTAALDVAAPSSGAEAATLPTDQPSSDVIAESSSADVERKSLLDVARAAIEQKPADAPAPSGQKIEGDPASKETAPTDAATPEPGKTDDLAAAKPDDYSDLDKQFGRHPRFKELREERNSARKRVEELAPAAEQYQKIQGFMDQEGLSADDTAQGFTLMALATKAQSGSREHAEEFLKQIEPLRNQLLELTGQRVADPLRERVESGALPEEDARRQTQLEAQNRALHSQRERDAQERQSQQIQSEQNRAKGAVAEWETGIRSRDPDFERKQTLVIDKMGSIVLKEGRPANAEAAVKLAQRAYAEVNVALGAFVPKPVPVIPAPQATRAPASPLPLPRNLLEVAQRALQGNA